MINSKRHECYIEEDWLFSMNDNFKRPSWDEYFMLQAELAKLRSNCITRQVGAVITRDHRQLATGYNGTPPGITNCYEGGCKRCADRMEGKIKSGEALDRCVCNHAEANAIMHCAILGIEATTNQSIVGIVQNNKIIYNYFLFFYLQSQYWHLRNFSHGSVQSGLNLEILRNYSISLPPYDEQEQIYDFLQKETSNFDDLISKSQSQIKILQEKRQALITAAVTGKIDVRNGVAA